MQTDLFATPAQNPAQIDWQPSRTAGLARLAAFVPFAGAAYARGRNSDLGPDNRANVSCLSPWIARRMITEEEVMTAILRQHRFQAAEKFIQEVYWRTYWKGWLELRPDVLARFNRERLVLQKRVADDAELAAKFDRAMSGQTGIDCFDAWVGELVTLGWLHNHARMWFASIWIFTLGLPWQLGADFFYKNLLDADSASNTLSWRWVAGLHTKGKHYLARASNIATHTNGRFDPRGLLNENAETLFEQDMTPGPGRLPERDDVRADSVGLLITQEDLNPATLDIGAKVVAAACLSPQIFGSPNSPRNQFSAGAMADAKSRTQSDFGIEVASLATTQDIVDWAQKGNMKEIVTAYAPTGLIAWHLADVRAGLAQVNIRMVQIQRPWDSLTWPLATGGFFKLKEKLPNLVSNIGGR
jgi:deoxyribodipyrimidine photo-lyase